MTSANTYKNEKIEKTELIPSESYFSIYGFMRSQMGLEKTELLVYALIYGYFRNSTPFTASRRYVCEWVGAGYTAVSEAIASLINKGYIRREARRERGINVIEYAVNIETLPPCVYHNNLIKIYNEDKRKYRIM